MALTPQTVKYVAELSRIELSDQELEKLSKQLESILTFIDQLKLLDVSSIQPTSHILPVNNVLREDQPRDSLPIEKVLANAPKKKDNFFIVPKVIE
jgi:aspartyl-tRNA(Asn)/glutamyl-tRNA(Gln) amidotransferase subunit C